MKIKTNKYQLAKHNDAKIPGYDTLTLLVENGKVDKYGYYKKGTIVAQFFGKTIEDAENLAETVLQLLNKDSK